MPTYGLIFLIIVFGGLFGMVVFSFKKSTEVKEENDPQREEIEAFYIFSIGVERAEKFTDYMLAKKFARENPYLLCRRSNEFKWMPAHKRFALNGCYIFKHPSGQIQVGYYYDDSDKQKDEARKFALSHPFYKVAWLDFDQKESTPLKWEKPRIFFNIPY